MPLACGAAVVPERTLVFIDDERLSRVGMRREIPVNLGPEFLSAKTVAFVAFEDLSRR